MKVPAQWNDIPELLEFVTGALENQFYDEQDGPANMSGVRGTDECGSYGEEGFVEITMADGRRFRMDLHEIV